MRTIAAGQSIATRVVSGTLESLPFCAGVADIVWISAALHHTPDITSALREIARVLRPRGRLFIRGYFPDRSRVPWLELFPGRQRAMARFPTVARMRALLPAAGLALVDIVDVEEGGEVLPADAAFWIAAMRDADSLLTSLSDEDIRKGISALRALPENPFPPVKLTLITAERLTSPYITKVSTYD
jgi:SAM-dependent methyltransferase